MMQRVAQKVYVADGESGELLSPEPSWLSDVIEDEKEREEALEELRRYGRYWAGGGASPLLFLYCAN